MWAQPEETNTIKFLAVDQLLIHLVQGDMKLCTSFGNFFWTFFKLWIVSCAFVFFQYRAPLYGYINESWPWTFIAMHETEDMTDAFTNEKVHVAGRVLTPDSVSKELL